MANLSTKAVISNRIVLDIQVEVPVKWPKVKLIIILYLEVLMHPHSSILKNKTLVMTYIHKIRERCLIRTNNNQTLLKVSDLSPKIN